MDIDNNDFDGKFLDQFRSMGTTDRDVLIAEFQAVLGNNINPESCAFFLDMNNWNLQNAVCSYYDFEQPSNALPSMVVIADMTIGEGESVAPNTVFVKTWKIRNSGSETWPPGCHLRYCSGYNLSTFERRMVNSLSPGETTEISMEMRSPTTPGTYISLWRMSSPTGAYFGELPIVLNQDLKLMENQMSLNNEGDLPSGTGDRLPVWSHVVNVNVIVAEGGLLGLTQQLSRIGGNESAVPNQAFPAEPPHPFQVPDLNPSVQLHPEQLLNPFPAAQMIEQDPNKAKLLQSSGVAGEEDIEMS